MQLHAQRLALAALLALSLSSAGCAGEPARAEQLGAAVEAGAEDPPPEDEPDDPEAGAPAAPSGPEPDAEAPVEPDAEAPPEPDAEAPPEPPAAVELPLALCEKYFPQTSPLLTLSMATMAFWADENCAVEGLFGEDIDATIDFVNYLRDWSLLILGCEPPHDVPGGAARFGPAWPVGDAPLAQADLDALIDHFLSSLTQQVPLDAEDEALLRAGLVQLSAGVSRCADCPPQLDRCAADGE